MSTPWRIILSVLTIGLSVFLAVDRPPQLGLDLEGGTQVVLDLEPREGEELTPTAATDTVEVLRNRVDSLGVTEPNLEVSGDDRIIVELPGVTDPEQAVEVIGSTAQLSFHRVTALPGPAAPSTTTPEGADPSTTTQAPEEEAPTTTSAGLGAGNDTSDANTVLGQAEEAPAEQAPSEGTPPATDAPAAPQETTGNTAQGGTLADEDGQLVQFGPAAFTGEGVADATARPPSGTQPSWSITVDFQGDGSQAWQQLTGEAACAPVGDPTRQIAIVLDDQVISHPQVSPDGSTQCGAGQSGGNTEITGQFTEAEAKNLALLVRGGALPVDVSIASQQVIGPELGDEAISASLNAVVIGGILTLIYILAVYRVLGVLAGIALAAFGVITYAAVVGLNITLTLPGIAGFVLGIAMATDSNVLVYERAKEEFDNGKTLRGSGRTGFKNALSAIIDSNVTTAIAAVTLFIVAIGEVRGFAVMLAVGTAVSVFVTLVVLRTLVTGTLALDWSRNHPRMLGMYVGQKFRRRMAENPPNLMRHAKKYLVVTLVVITLALGGVFIRGINFGIEFTGGRLLEYSTPQAVNLDQAREEMAEIGYPRAVVQRSGSDDVSIRVPELNAEQLAQVDQSMEELGGGPADKLRDETISGSFSDELKNKAILGLIAGVGFQLLWVAYRFRWTFGLGAVGAMVHNSLLVLGLFAWLQKPFDSVFLAALLTVIAFSMNDVVVVFDRIREQRRRRTSESFADVTNDACVQTFPRSVNITMSAIFILLTLYFFGGQTLGDFALALTIGIVVSVYASVFVASPIAILLERLKPAEVGSKLKPRKPVAKKSGENGEEEEIETTASTSSGTRKAAPRPRKKSSRRPR
jgi:SecD/SecF fusion protein